MITDQKYKELKTQLITRKVNPDCLTGAYYKQVRNDIRRKIKPDTELLIIKIVPRSPITQKYVLESFMHLQRELTSIITIPENYVIIGEDDFNEFEMVFDCAILRRG